MKHFAKVVFLVALLIQLSAPCYSRPKDILGWQGARWGRLERDILRTYASRLTKLPKREDFAGLYVDYVIPDFTLDGNVYTIFFQMNKRTSKLDQILIRMNEMETRNPREETFNHLGALLTI